MFLQNECKTDNCNQDSLPCHNTTKIKQTLFTNVYFIVIFCDIFHGKYTLSGISFYVGMGREKLKTVLEIRNAQKVINAIKINFKDITGQI